MRGQVEQRDLPTAPRGHGDLVGQVVGDRIGERDLSAGDHVRQQRRRKHLRDRADLEERFRTQGSRVRTGVTIRDDTCRAVGFHDADHDADCPVLFHAGPNQRGEILVGREVLSSGGPWEQERCCEENEGDADSHVHVTTPGGRIGSARPERTLEHSVGHHGYVPVILTFRRGRQARPRALSPKTRSRTAGPRSRGLPVPCTVNRRRIDFIVGTEAIGCAR